MADATHNLGVDIIPDLSKIENGLADLQRDFKKTTEFIVQANRTIAQSMQTTSSKIKKTGWELKKLDKAIEDYEQNAKSMNKANQETYESMSNLGMATNFAEKQFEDFEDISGQVRRATTNVTESMEDYQREINALSKKNEELAHKTTESTNAIKKNERALRGSSDALDDQKDKTDKVNGATENWLSSYSKSTSIAIKSTVIWGAATTVVYGLQRALEVTTETLKEVNKEMIGLRKVMNETTTDFDAMKETAQDLGTDFGQTIPEVIDGMKEWARQGKKQNQTLELTRASLLATNVAEMEVAESVKYLTSATLQFQIASENAIEVVDRWNEVSNNFAVTSVSLAESIQESGSAAKQTGVSIDELIGLTTALSSATGKSGSRIGNALKTMFSRMAGRGKEGAEALGKVEEKLNGIGLSLRNSQHDYKDTMTVLKELATVWEGLSEVQQANISYALGGRRRYSDIMALMENFNIVLAATETSLDSQGSAMKENEKVMKSLYKQIDQVKVAAQKSGIALGQAGLTDIIKGVANIAEGLFGILERLAVGFERTGKVGKTLIAILGVGGLVTAIVKLISAVKQLSVVTKVITSLSNPWVAGITATITALGALSFWLGREKDQTDSLIDSKKRLNEIRENGIKFIKGEGLAQAQKDVDKYKNKIQELREVMDTPAKDFSEGGILGGQVRKQLDVKKVAEDIKEIFPEEFEGISDNNKVLEKAKQILSDYNEILADNIALNQDQVAKLFNKTMNRKKEVAQLEYQIEAWKKLNSKRQEGNKLTKKEINRFNTLTKLLQSQHKQLMGLSKQEMGTQLSNILKNQTTSMNTTVKNAKEELKSYRKEWATVLENLEADYTEGLEKSLAKGMNIRAAKKDNEELRKKIEETSNFIDSLTQKINKLGEDVNWTEFLTNSEEGMKVFKSSVHEKLIDPLDEFNKRFKTIEKTFQKSMAGLELKSDYLDLSELEIDKQMKEIFDTRRDSLITLQANLDTSNIENKRKEVVKKINEMMQSENLTAERKGELELLKQEVENTKEVKSLRQAIVNLIVKSQNESSKLNEQIKAGTDLKNIKDNFEKMAKVDISKPLSDLSLDKLKDYRKQVQSNIDKLSAWKQGLKAVDTTKLSTEQQEKYNNLLKLISQTLDSIIDKEKKIGKNIKLENLENEADKLFNKFVMDTDENELQKNIKNVREKLNQALKLNASEGTIVKLRTALHELKLSEEQLKSFEDAKVNLEGIVNQIDKLDLDKAQGLFTYADEIKQTNKELEKMKKALKKIKQLHKTGAISDKQYEKLSKIISEEDIEKAKEYLDELKQKVADIGKTISNSIADGFNSVDLRNDNGAVKSWKEVLKEGTINALINAFSSEEISQTIGNMVGSLFGGEAGGKIANGVSTTLQTVGKSLKKGNKSQAWLSGIGAGIGAIFGVPQIGAAVGNAVNSIGEALVGDSTGVKDKQSAKKINKGIEKGLKILKEFGIEIDVNKASWEDMANAVEDFFGKEEYEVYNKEQAKEDLERIKKLIEYAQVSLKGMSSSFSNALKNATSYKEFKTHFEQGVGQAIQDTLINALLKSEAIKSAMKGLSGKIAMAVEDGMITDKEMGKIKESYESTKESMKNAYEQVNRLKDEFSSEFNQTIGGTNNQTFEAGTTSNITYHNEFSVNTQTYLGDEEQARESAELLAPYIMEYIERNSGA